MRRGGQPEEVARAQKWQSFAHELATDLHEVIGHANMLANPKLADLCQLAGEAA